MPNEPASTAAVIAETFFAGRARVTRFPNGLRHFVFEATSDRTGMFCLDFIGELGHRFNRREAPPVDVAQVARLQALLDRYVD